MSAPLLAANDCSNADKHAMKLGAMHGKSNWNSTKFELQHYRAEPQSTLWFDDESLIIESDLIKPNKAGWRIDRTLQFNL